MKTLPDILRDALLLLDEGHESVVIAREQQLEPLDACSSAYQLRLRHEDDIPHYKAEGRAWLGGQWSRWRDHRGWLGGAGFDISDVLATDWRIT